MPLEKPGISLGNSEWLHHEIPSSIELNPAMPTIVVKTYANLRKYTDGAPSVELDIEPGTTIQGVLERLRVPPGEARIIFINGRSVSLDCAVQDGEKVELFSAIGGG